MQPRTTLVLGLVALVLGAFVWFYEIGGEAGRNEAAEAGKRLFPDIAATDIRWVEITTPDATPLRAERGSEGGWRIVSPVDFPGDPVALDGLASALADLSSERQLESPEALAVYRLDGGPALRFGADERESGLRIGRDTPVGGNAYVARVGDDEVYIVASWRVNALRKSLDDLRDRRILPFDREAVTRIEVRWPGQTQGPVVLEPVEGGEGSWRMVAPIEAPADRETVDGLLSDLAYLRADSFADDVASPRDAGLVPPDLEIRLRLEPEQGEPLERVFALGQERDGKRLARGLHSTGTTYYVLRSERIGEFPRRVSAYRNRELARFTNSDARRLEIELRDGTADTTPLRVEARRTEAGSWASEPPMRDGVAVDIVANLALLRADDVLAERVGSEERVALGLDPPRAHLRVLGAGEGDVLADVAIGVLDDAGLVVAVPGSPAVFRVEGRLAENLPISKEAFRARFAAEAEPAAPAPAEAEPAKSDSP